MNETQQRYTNIITVIVIVIVAAVALYLASPNRKSTVSSTLTVTTYSQGDFSTEGIWRTTDSNGKAWTIDYVNSAYSERTVKDGKEHIESGDFAAWLRMEKKVTAPGYTGPGIPGSIIVLGTLDQVGTLVATKIIRNIE